MIAQSNVTHMIVGKDLDLLSASGTRDDLAVGQIGVFLVGSKTAKTDALASGDRFTIVYRNSKGVLIETPVIDYDTVKEKSAVEYTAPSQKVVAVGYNGTSGSIDVEDNNDYVFHIFFKDNSTTFAKGTPVKFAAYRSSDSATQVEIADGLAENFNKNFARENPKLIKAEVIVSASGAAITGTGDLTVKNGSKYVVAATDADAELTVGDYIRFGTNTSAPVYKVTAIDATNNIITLHMPYQGDSETVAEADANVVTSADAASANAGVLLTGLPITASFDPGIIRYDVVEFNVELKDDFGSTNIEELSAASVGAGTYWEVAQNEWFLKGNRGEPWRLGNYPKTVVLEATEGKVYDQISFNYVDYNARTVDRHVGSFGTVMIATEDEDSSTIHTDLKTVLGI